MPVDQADNSESDEGKLKGELQQSGGGEFGASSYYRTDQGPFLALVVVDANDQAIPGAVKPKIKVEIDRRIRGNIKIFRSAEAESPLVKRNQIWLQFSERIAHLRDSRERGTILALAIPNRKGIEEVSETSGVGQKEDSGGLFCLALTGKEGFRIGPDGAARNELKMVVVAEGIKPGKIVRKNRDRFGDRFQFIDIEGKEEDVIDEFIPFGREATMLHGALVEAGTKWARVHDENWSCSCNRWASSRPER